MMSLRTGDRRYAGEQSRYRQSTIVHGSGLPFRLARSRPPSVTPGTALDAEVRVAVACVAGGRGRRRIDVDAVVE